MRATVRVYDPGAVIASASLPGGSRYELALRPGQYVVANAANASANAPMRRVVEVRWEYAPRRPFCK